MSKFVSIQIEMKTTQSDCVVFELPKGITQEEFNTIAEKQAEQCHYTDEWINTVRKVVFDKCGKYPEITEKRASGRYSEIELLQLEHGNMYREDLFKVIRDQPEELVCPKCIVEISELNAE